MPYLVVSILLWVEPAPVSFEPLWKMETDSPSTPVIYSFPVLVAKILKSSELRFSFPVLLTKLVSVPSCVIVKSLPTPTLKDALSSRFILLLNVATPETEVSPIT